MMRPPGPHLSCEPTVRANTDLGYTVVIPTVGRSTLADLLADIADLTKGCSTDAVEGSRAATSLPAEIVIVGDRRVAVEPLDLDLQVPDDVRIVSGRARGPAAARNDGWRAAATRWIVFLDDDVRLTP